MLSEIRSAALAVVAASRVDRESNEELYAAIDALDAALSAPEAAVQAEREGAEPALARYNRIMGACEDQEHDPLERLRFFLSLALSGQDWLDVEPFIDALKSKPQSSATVPEEWRTAVNLLLECSRAAWFAAEESEERVTDGLREHVIFSGDFDNLSNALNALDELPDPEDELQVYSGAMKAAHMLRNLLAAPATSYVRVEMPGCAPHAIANPETKL